MPSKVRDELLIHSQTSMVQVQLLKFGNGQIILSHTLFDAGIKVKPS